jgi:hypothetical protein
MTAPDLMEKIWRQVEPSVFISRREFMAGLEGWDIAAREIDGEIVGATLVRGPEFHFVSFGARKTFASSLIADCLQPIIAEHGFVRTRTPKDDLRQRRFNERIGFRVESEDEYFTIFRAERINLHRAQPCL